MASISFTVTDSKHGVMSTSFKIREEDVRRVSNALRTIYQDEFPQGTLQQDITDELLFSMFSNYVVTYLLDISYKEEVNVLMKRAQEQAPQPIQLLE